MYLRAVLDDLTCPPLPESGARRPQSFEALAFGVEAADAPRALSCGDVPGFREALLAAYDPQAPLPQRLGLVGPDRAMSAWLATWAEDTVRVRRTLTVERRLDGKKITAVATLSSYGGGVETSLAVESITASWRRGARPRTRSGVHARAQLDAALEPRCDPRPRSLEPRCDPRPRSLERRSAPDAPLRTEG